MGAIALSFTDFENTFHRLAAEIVNDDELLNGEPLENKPRLREIFVYNTEPLAELRGYFVPKSYVALCGSSITPDNLELAYVLGWLIQGIQTFVFMIDDYLDGDLTRWGKPTWYAKTGKSKQTLTDAIRLEQLIYKFLFKYFQHLNTYKELAAYFHNSVGDFFAGQDMEERWSFKNDPNFDNYTMEKYRLRTSVTNKKVYYDGNFVVPMILLGRNDGTLLRQVDQFCTLLVHYSVCKDDLHDSFEDQKLANPCIDRDIRQGVPKLLIIKALELCSEDQLRRIKSSLGKDNDQDAAIVKDVYVELGLPKIIQGYLGQLETQLWEMTEEYGEEGCVFLDLFREAIPIFRDSRHF